MWGVAREGLLYKFHGVKFTHYELMVARSDTLHCNKFLAMFITNFQWCFIDIILESSQGWRGAVWARVKP